MNKFQYLKYKKELEQLKYVKDIEMFIRDKKNNTLKYKTSIEEFLFTTDLITHALHLFKSKSNKILPTFIYEDIIQKQYATLLKVFSTPLSISYKDFLTYFKYYDYNILSILAQDPRLLKNCSLLFSNNIEHKNMNLYTENIRQHIQDYNLHNYFSVMRSHLTANAIELKTTINHYSVSINPVFEVKDNKYLDLYLTLNAYITLAKNKDEVIYLQSIFNDLTKYIPDRLIKNIQYNIDYYKFLYDSADTTYKLLSKLSKK